MESMPRDMIRELCRKMDNRTLKNFIETNQQAHELCQSILEKRKVILHDTRGHHFYRPKSSVLTMDDLEELFPGFNRVRVIQRRGPKDITDRVMKKGYLRLTASAYEFDRVYPMETWEEWGERLSQRLQAIQYLEDFV